MTYLPVHYIYQSNVGRLPLLPLYIHVPDKLIAIAGLKNLHFCLFHFGPLHSVSFAENLYDKLGCWAGEACSVHAASCLPHQWAEQLAQGKFNPVDKLTVTEELKINDLILLLSRMNGPLPR